MANTIQVKRGANASLPILNAAEFGFSTDTHQIYIGDGAVNHELAKVSHSANKTSAAWSKTIGSGGDYADWATMIATMPDLIAHAVTVTIKSGTTLTETCDLKNKHGLTSAAAITVQAEKYFPTSGALPTADSATATTLRDAALAMAALGNDYFNGCWVFVVDGTGTDNGFVSITDYVDATGDVIVASWPGTQPDNTSRYLIVGALIDCEASRNSGFEIQNNTIRIYSRGVGIDDALSTALSVLENEYIDWRYCGYHGAVRSGVEGGNSNYISLRYSGMVNNNSESGGNGGIRAYACSHLVAVGNGISDNKIQGIFADSGSFCTITANFGDNNGLWGCYAQYSGRMRITGTECSGSSGNHSDPGTAGNANADQAAAY